MTTSTLTLDRHLAAAPEQVWTAWTTPAGLAAWWWNHWSDTTIEADARPGGTYRFAAPDHGIAATGTYTEVDAPHRLAFSWIWETDGEPSPEDHVVVTITPEDGGSHLVVEHSGPWANGDDEGPREGWNFTLDSLDATLTRARGIVR